MKLGDYAITEAGFGSDLGAEKFYNIKCRAAGLNPAAVVLVTSTKALKWHGGVPPEIGKPNAEALKKGLCNLDAHVENLKRFGPNIVVSINHFHTDLDEELDIIRNRCAGTRRARGPLRRLRARRQGCRRRCPRRDRGCRGRAPAQLHVRGRRPRHGKRSRRSPRPSTALPPSNWLLPPPRISSACRRTSASTASRSASPHPVLVLSRSQAPRRSEGFTLPVQRLILNAGAGFVVVTTGAIMRMPGLPKVPAAMSIDVKDGKITGLA